jgi:hypothetical protein
VKIDGHSLTTAAVVAAARYFASVELDDRKEIKAARGESPPSRGQTRSPAEQASMGFPQVLEEVVSQLMCVLYYRF